ncbi:MAG: hypothetical protein KAR79_05035, partial [Simkaniaceae bacterium]|nr:hypothetical protein [Simkaniaceae bacterium]
MSSEISGSASQETNFITYYLEECGVMEVLNNEWFTTLALSIIATAGLTIYLTTTISASLACLGVCILSAPFALNCCYDLFVESTENPVTRMDNPTQNNIITTPAIVDSFDLVDSIEHYQTTLRLNQQHFADSIAFEREGISFPDGVDPDSIDYAQLITLADQINTSDDAREDYIPPAQATQDDPTYDQTGRVIRQNWMTIEQVRSGIATFVNCIQRRTAIAGISGMTPDQNRDFFNTIEN